MAVITNSITTVSLLFKKDAKVQFNKLYNMCFSNILPLIIINRLLMLSVGLERTCIRDIREDLDNKLSSEDHRDRDQKIDFLVAPLFHPRYRRDSIDLHFGLQSLSLSSSAACDPPGISCTRQGPSTRSDRELECAQWMSNFVGKISEWIELDNPDMQCRIASENALRQEIEWASHLSLQNLLLPTPRLNAPNYARHIRHLLDITISQGFMLRIPLMVPMTYHSSADERFQDGWILWDNFRQIAGHKYKLSVALELFSCGELLTCAEGEELKPAMFSTENMSRWSAEPVKAVFVDCNIFIANKAGYPVLPKNYQRVLNYFWKYPIQIIIKGKADIQPKEIQQSSLGKMEAYKLYIQYLRHLKRKFLTTAPDVTDGERYTNGYNDTLQIPLQPLMDNLESQTYETFERDPIKYIKYERAIHKALLYIHSKRLLEESVVRDDSMYSDENRSITPIVITVVGAGRGPLVAAALTAAVMANINVHVFAVEKNQNAIITLRNRIRSELWNNVTLIAKDMRHWEPKTTGEYSELCDIMVSELLGSFGDNELSPECLDGAQRCMKQDGISIPCDYTSFIAPIATSKLWMCANETLSPLQPTAQQLLQTGNRGLNTPYVVKFHNCYRFAKAKPLFRFVHPNPCAGVHAVDNTRYGSVSFVSEVCMTLHGIAGYFESTLYADEMLSIAPHSHTDGMLSWFPLYFPLCNPVRVQPGDEIAFSIWRCVDSRKVWYEWCMTSPIQTPIQNSGGSSYSIGL